MIAELQIAIPLAVAFLLISAFCSGTEVALFSIRRFERGQLAHGNRLTDRRIVAMLDQPRRLVATMLVGNEAANSALAVIAFVVLSQRFSPDEALWLAIAVALPLIVLFTEVTAKTLAAKAPLTWSRLCVLPLAAFALAVSPVRVVIQAITGLVLAPFGGAIRHRPSDDLSEEEFRTLIDAGSVQGQVDARERRLIHRVFEFNDKNVGQVMTPRDRIFALSYDLPVQRLVKELAARGFSRVPIYQRSLDNIRGILNAKDLVRTMAGQPLGRPLGDLLHEPLFVPRTTPVKRLFLTFKQKKVHMAIVVSEYGKVLGLVTMDDLLSQIFGVLRDERAELQNTIPPGRGPGRIPADVRDISTGPIVARGQGGDGGDGGAGGGAAGGAPDPGGDGGAASGEAGGGAASDASDASEGGVVAGPSPGGSGSMRRAGRGSRPSMSGMRSGDSGSLRRSGRGSGPIGGGAAGSDGGGAASGAGDAGSAENGGPPSAAPDAPSDRGDERSGPIIQPDLSPAAAIGVLDPPPRPIHTVDEVTPPATDIAELERSGEDGGSR